MAAKTILRVEKEPALGNCIPCDGLWKKTHSVRYQDEPKSIFYKAQQITVHPVVAFYHSPEVPQLISRNSLVFLGDDINHDHHAVDHLFEKAISHIKNLGINFAIAIVFSDGCASQNKGKRVALQT